MRLILEQVAEVLGLGNSVAVATVVETVGSSPREVGAAMALVDTGAVIGSLSGGCLEAEVVANSEAVLADGRSRASTYGPSDTSELFAVGLTCGGLIEVVIRRYDPRHADLIGRIHLDEREGRPVVFASLVDTESGAVGLLVHDADGLAGTLGDAGLDAAVAAQLPGLLAAAWSGKLRLGATGRRDEVGTEVFVESFAPAPEMVIVGAIDAAEALSRLAGESGFRVSVVDPRPLFTTAARFPRAHEVAAEWPDRFLARRVPNEQSAVCVLSHDPRIDVPTILAALRNGAGYVGAMGSLRTHLDRTRRLIEAGATDGELERLHSPIGLAIGAATPTEIAISILAEVVASRSVRRHTGAEARHLVV